MRLALDGREHDGIEPLFSGRRNAFQGTNLMDLVTLVTACALAVDPKLMHALIWHQSGGEPWAIAVSGEPNPRVYPNMNDAIREVRSASMRGVVRAGLAGVPVPPARISASVLLPCRNVAMAAVQITKLTGRCKTHPRLKADPAFCAVAVYRGSWERPDAKFATDVLASVAKGDAPNFDMPRGTGTEIFDIANGQESDVDMTVVDITSTFSEQTQGWSSALFPTKAKRVPTESARIPTAAPPTDEPSPPGSPAAFPFNSEPQDRELFVRRVGGERP
jgi:hypothetical protein